MKPYETINRVATGSELESWSPSFWGNRFAKNSEQALPMCLGYLGYTRPMPPINDDEKSLQLSYPSKTPKRLHGCGKCAHLDPRCATKSGIRTYLADCKVGRYVPNVHPFQSQIHLYSCSDITSKPKIKSLISWHPCFLMVWLAQRKQTNKQTNKQTKIRQDML